MSAVGQDTPLKPLDVVPGGGGSIAQAEPFHCSSSGVVLPPLIVPTAMQELPDAQEMSLSPAEIGVTKLGLGSSDQWERCQRSTSVADCPVASDALPTATQDDLGPHEAPPIDGFVPAGTAMLASIQRPPFQWAVNGTGSPDREVSPVRTQSRRDPHDTAFTEGLFPPCGSCTCWIVHREPFHRAANGVVRPRRLEVPTTRQSAAESHQTPPSATPGSLGPATSVQRAPFRRSTSAR